MEEFISNAEALVMLYAPIIFTYVLQIIGFIQAAMRLKKMNVKEDVTSIVKPLKTTIADLSTKLESSLKQSEEAKAMNNIIVNENISLKRDYAALSASIDEKIDAQNKLLNDLVKKNVEWEAKARIADKKLKEK